MNATPPNGAHLTYIIRPDVEPRVDMSEADTPALVIECNEEWGLAVTQWEFGTDQPDPAVEIRFLASAFKHRQARDLVALLADDGKTATLSDVVAILDQIGAANVTPEQPNP